MYTTTSNATGIITTCSDCDYQISLNEICQRPLQAATEMLKHLTVHNARKPHTIGSLISRYPKA
jgi:hypothetical protein